MIIIKYNDNNQIYRIITYINNVYELLHKYMYIYIYDNNIIKHIDDINNDKQSNAMIITIM